MRKPSLLGLTLLPLLVMTACSRPAAPPVTSTAPPVPAPGQTAAASPGPGPTPAAPTTAPDTAPSAPATATSAAPAPQPAPTQSFGPSTTQATAAGLLVTNVDGAGHAVLVKGTLNEWTDTPVLFEQDKSDIFKVDGANIRVSLLRAEGMENTVFLVQRRAKNTPDALIDAQVLFFQPDGGHSRGQFYIRPSSDGNGPTSLKSLQAGPDSFQTALEMADDYRHTITATWRVTYNQNFGLRLVSDGPPMAPAVPLGPIREPDKLLRAALFAASHWYALTDELNGMVATPQAADILKQTVNVNRLQNAGRYSGVWQAWVGDVKAWQAPQCPPQVTPKPVTPGQPVGFVAQFGARNGCGAIWGTVQFKANADGSLLIDQLQVTNQYEAPPQK